MSASSESTPNPSHPPDLGSSSVPPLQQPPARAAADASTQSSEEINRQQPIPPPSELLQYRAIGLVRGRYQPSEEQFNRGNLLTEDGTQLDAVLLGQVMSLVKKHLDLDKEHLWVVYPRTREKLQTLHLQIVGVWEPEQLNPAVAEETASGLTDDGFFSVRGEIIFQSPEKGFVVVKIQQSARKGSEPPKFFKVRVEGTVTLRPGYFWDVEASRQGNNLVLVKANAVALLPPKKPAKVNRDRPKPSRDRSGSPSHSARPGNRAAGGSSSSNPRESRQPFSKPVKPIKRNPDAN
jgi:hypothetical protein